MLRCGHHSHSVIALCKFKSARSHLPHDSAHRTARILADSRAQGAAPGHCAAETFVDIKLLRHEHQVNDGLRPITWLNWNVVELVSLAAALYIQNSVNTSVRHVRRIILYSKEAMHTA